MVKRLNDSPFEKKPVKLVCIDEMRFGLISNYKRSWSIIGKRTVIANQQEFANKLFENIEYQEAVIDEEVAKWIQDPQKMKKLAGYDWILDQFKTSCI